MTSTEIYFLDDAVSLYHGRKVETIRHLSGVGRVVRVVGTRIEIVTTLWRLSPFEVAALTVPETRDRYGGTNGVGIPGYLR